MARVPNIRGTDSVPAGPLAWLKEWLESLRTWVRMRDPAEATVGDALDKFTTRGDLVQWGVVTRNAGGAFIGSGGGGGGAITIVVPPGPGGGSAYVPDLTPPPTPTGLVVTAGITNIYIGLDAPTYTVGNGHAQTNIYGAIWAPGDTEPTFSDPRTKFIDNIVGPGTFHAYPSNPATRWCIWIKFQTRDGIESTSPAGGTHGVQATTGQDVAALLEILTGQITASQLFTDLARPIGQLLGRYDELSSNTLAASLAVHEEMQARAQALLNEAIDRGTSITDVRRVVNEGDAQLAQSITTLTAVVGGNAAAIENESLARANAISAEALQRTTLATQVRGAYTGTDVNVLSEGLIFSERQARVGADSAQVLRLDTLEATVNNPATGVTATASALDAVELTVNNGTTGVVATAGRVSGLEASVNTPNSGNNPTFARLLTEETTRASLDGSVAALYTLRAEVSGAGGTVIGGFGLSATSTVAGGARLDFGVRADRFFVAPPAGSAVTSNIVPFTVQTSDETVNGVLVPRGVYMDAAFIKNVTAVVARLGTAWIDDAMVGTLSAAKLTVGDGTVGGNLKSTVFTAGSGSTPGTGWRLTPAGLLQASGATIYGTIYASAGVFAGSLSAATGTFAGSLSAATGTFSGNLSAAGGTFTGALSGATGSFTGTLTVGSSPAISGTTMTGSGGVINSSGTLALGNATTNLTFDGAAMKMNGAWITAANLNLGAFTLTVDDSAVTASGPSPVDVSQAVTVTPSGGTGTITYSWRMVQDGAIANGPVELYFSGNVFAASITVGARATNTGSQITGYAICTARDANGRTAEAAVFLSATCV